MKFISSGFLICLLTLSSGIASAEEKGILEMSLEELLEVKVVTANKRETESLKVAAIVTILTPDQLTFGGAENLGDALRFASGVSTRKSPGGLPQYNTAIRGNVSDFLNMRTLFLIDGVPVRNINAGFDPGWIPLSIIERVEIVKGPNSNLWGANAFGGVINIITKKGSDFKERSGDFSLGVQSRYDQVEKDQVGGGFLSATAGKAGEKLSYLASTQNSRANDSDGLTGHSYQDVFARLTYQMSETVKLSMKGLFSYDKNQISLDFADESIKNMFTHVTSSLEIKLDADSTLRFTPYVNVFDHDLYYTNELNGYENLATSIGLNTQYTTTFTDLHSLVAGVDLVNEYGKLSTNAFDYSSFPFAVDHVGWDRRYQTTFGAYTQYEYLGWEKFRPTAGIRYDHNSLYGGALSPRVSLAHLMNKSFNLYGSIGRGFRAPVFNETHINGYGKIGDRELNPEIITTYELGLKSVHAKTQNSIAFFLQEVRDKITLQIIDESDPTPLSKYKNIGETKIWGVEFEGSYNFLPGFRAFYNSTLLKSDDGDGNKIERLIETKFVLGMDYTWETWRLRLVGTQEGAQFFYNTNDTIPDDSKKRVFLPKVVTGNVELSKKLGAGIWAKVYVDNFTNLEYRESFSSFEEPSGAPLPGRTVGAMFGKQF